MIKTEVQLFKGMHFKGVFGWFFSHKFKGYQPNFVNTNIAFKNHQPNKMSSKQSIYILQYVIYCYKLICIVYQPKHFIVKELRF